MRKTFFVIILLLLTINCSDNKLEKDTDTFKELVGKENIKTIDFLINDFEKNYLNREFPELKTNEAYKRFLIKISANERIDISDFSLKGIDKFTKSKLLLDIYEFPDTVWLDENLVVNMKFIDKLEDGTDNVRSGKAWKPIQEYHDKDSIISSELNCRHLLYSGKYINALDSIKNGNKYIYDYVDTRKLAGKISPTILANNMLKNDLDYSNYIIKSIILLELVY